MRSLTDEEYETLFDDVLKRMRDEYPSQHSAGEEQENCNPSQVNCIKLTCFLFCQGGNICGA